MASLSAQGLTLVPADVGIHSVKVNLSGTGPNITGDGVNLRPAGPIIHLSNATISDNAAIGTTIGVLSVTGGTGSYTYTLVSNPGTLFAISGSNLNVAAALTAGSDPISIKADNGAGSTVTQPFLITVTPSSNALQSDTGVDILADTGSPILVQ